MTEVMHGPGASGGAWEYRSGGGVMVTDYRRGPSGEWVPVGDRVVADDGGDTDDDDVVVCDQCGESVAIAATTMTGDDLVVCADSCSCSCEWCGTVCATGDVTERAGVTLCGRCDDQVVDCYHCDALCDPEQGTATDVANGWRDQWVCDVCVSRYHWCDVCESWRGPDVSGCDECEQEDDDDPGVVNGAGRLLPYDWRPPMFRFYTDHTDDPYVGRKFHDSSRLFFGVEIETENEGDAYKRDLIRHVWNTLQGVAYVKHDGSLEDGLEVVTHPMSFDFFDRWGALDQVLAYLAGEGCRSWGSHRCGIHVHVTRSAFLSRSHLFAFSLWWYRNREVVQKIAGRTDHSLDRWASLSAHQGPREYGTPRLLDKVNGQGHQTRYAGVNLSNDGTVEVRVFRGTLRPERVRGYVELVAAVWHYTAALNSHDIRAGFLTWDAFARYLDHDTYRNIAGLLAARGVK